MKRVFYILTLILFLTSCNQRDSINNTKDQKVIVNPYKPLYNAIENIKMPMVDRLSFKNISDIDSSHSTWVGKQKDHTYSLLLHFMDKDTLHVEYSPECWLRYKYKIENNRMLVYWNTYIDAKYDFDIVQAVSKIDEKYIGKKFVTLELINDTTFKAIYMIDDIRKTINSCNDTRVLFPDKFMLVQDVVTIP